VGGLPRAPTFLLCLLFIPGGSYGVERVDRHKWPAIGDYLSVFLFFILGLALSVPGLMIVSSRLFVIDKARGEVCRTFQIGPFKWRRSRKLSDFNLVRVYWEPDSDEGRGTYFVCLSGGAGTGALRIDSFESAQPANGLARELGDALGLPFSDARAGSGNEPGDLELKNRRIRTRSRPLKTPASETVSGSPGGAIAVGSMGDE
jgi:hypothetical protein